MEMQRERKRRFGVNAIISHEEEARWASSIDIQAGLRIVAAPSKEQIAWKSRILEKNVPPCFCRSFGNDSESSLHVLLSRRKTVSPVAIAFQSFQEQRQSGYTTFGRAVAILTLTRISWIGYRRNGIFTGGTRSSSSKWTGLSKHPSLLNLSTICCLVNLLSPEPSETYAAELKVQFFQVCQINLKLVLCYREVQGHAKSKFSW